MRSNWVRVCRTSPCPVCNAPDWCSVSADGAVAKCIRVEEGAWRSGTDKTGTHYHLHRLDGAARARLALPPPPLGSEAPRVGADLLHRAYSALLARLRLSRAHRQALKRRSLNDPEIDRHGYRTLPVWGRARLARGLRE